jgi:hypothetical protein
VCMCVCVYICVCICVYVSEYPFIHIHACTYAHQAHEADAFSLLTLMYETLEYVHYQLADFAEDGVVCVCVCVGMCMCVCVRVCGVVAK